LNFGALQLHLGRTSPTDQHPARSLWQHQLEMAFDCYCAICGVGFSGMRIGSPSDATAARRQQYVESVSRSLDARHSPLAPQDESIYSYDPRLVDRGSVAWTSEVHCLGVHDVQGKTK
jgi:hypothetical protein